MTTCKRRRGPGADGFFRVVFGIGASNGGAGTSTLGSGTGGLEIDILDSGAGRSGLCFGGVVAHFNISVI